MKGNMNRIIKIAVILFMGMYFIGCGSTYFLQKKILFQPKKLASDFVYEFENDFEEIFIEVAPNVKLNALLFKANNPKGLVFFLHGNSHNVDVWGRDSKLYTDNNYDVFYLDYRGYGKSEGKIESEAQLFSDAQIAYNQVKERYEENKIIVSGTSIGSGMAAQIASQNKPRMLLLNTPYYSIKRLAKEKLKILPDFIVQFPLQSHLFLQTVKCPIHIFHGDHDELIPIDHSLDLQKENPEIVLHTIAGATHWHRDVFNREQFIEEMTQLLNSIRH